MQETAASKSFQVEKLSGINQFFVQSIGKKIGCSKALLFWKQLYFREIC